MTINVEIPHSPGWWLNRLARKLVDRQKRLDDLIKRFEGDGPLPHVNDNLREAYREFQRKSRTNWAELIVEAPRERMVIAGFQTAASGSSEVGDEVAERIWEQNGLSVEIADVLQMMLAAGDGYMIVGDIDPDTGVPVITGEDPRQVVTIHDPERQRIVRAAAKLFHDRDEGRDYAYLYVRADSLNGSPDDGLARVFVATREIRRAANNQTVRFNPGSWEWAEDRGGEEGEPLRHQHVPVVRFRNRRGVGEFELHRDLLDRIDYMTLQRLVITTYQAFKQRAVKGLPDEDDEGNEIDWKDVFSADPGAMFQVPDGVDFWESGIVDITPLLNGVKDDLRSLAAVTRTALSYLTPDAVSGSAEGASLMREAQVFRTEDRMARAAEALKDVMHIAFVTMGDDQRARRAAIRPLWAPPERLSLTERGDASSKAQDIPWRHRMMRVWGFDPDEVDRMEVDRAREQLQAAALAAPAPQPALPVGAPAPTDQT